MNGDSTHRVRLDVTPEQARYIATLLRHAVSLNTTAGLLAAERRLASSTQRAAELAALVLEGNPFDEALRGAEEAWSGSLEEDHASALRTLDHTRALLQERMPAPLTQQQAAELAQIAHDQMIDLLRIGLDRAEPEPNP